MFLIVSLILFSILFVILFLSIVYRVARLGQLRQEKVRLDSEIALIKERLAIIAERLDDRKDVLQSTLSELEKRYRDQNKSTPSS